MTVMGTGSSHCYPSVTGQKASLTCDGAAYSASPSPDAGAVPDHGVLRALVSVAHPVSVPRVFVKARFFSCGKNESPCERLVGKNFPIPRENLLSILRVARDKWKVFKT